MTPSVAFLNKHPSTGYSQIVGDVARKIVGLSSARRQVARAGWEAIGH